MRLNIHPVVWLLTALACGPFTIMAESGTDGPVTGPVIEGYGPVFELGGDAYRLDPGVRYRSVMDVASSPEDKTALNRHIESAARFLNMHAREGVPQSGMELAVVLHGAAGKDALSDEAYRRRFGQPNPNTGLIRALREAGVEIYICGQTARFRGYLDQEISHDVTMATSAMTVLTRLQVEGWSLLP
jgi:intracellular sulfur oxidation DsrE/DsrF family protein